MSIDLYRCFFENFKESENGNFEFEKVFNSEFMRSNTKFSSIGEFLKSAGIEVEIVQQLSYEDEKLDKFVKSNTIYKTWVSMVNDAILKYYKQGVFENFFVE